MLTWFQNFTLSVIENIYAVHIYKKLNFFDKNQWLFFEKVFKIPTLTVN